jgi:hypothetical protein
MKRQMTIRVVAIQAFDDGVLGHGLTHRVTLLSRGDDGRVQGTLELTTADPRVHELWIAGSDYTLTVEPVRTRNGRKRARRAPADAPDDDPLSPP